MDNKIGNTSLTNTIYVDAYNVLLDYHNANPKKADQEKEQRENQRKEILDKIKANIRSKLTKKRRKLRNRMI